MMLRVGSWIGERGDGEECYFLLGLTCAQPTLMAGVPRVYGRVYDKVMQQIEVGRGGRGGRGGRDGGKEA
eukprot:765491-Hanusia_phi.AAC.4